LSVNRYSYSSHLNFASKEERLEKVILNKTAFQEYFQINHGFEEFLEEWLTYGEDFSLESSLMRNLAIRVCEK
jgi:hypothetical protein